MQKEKSKSATKSDSKESPKSVSQKSNRGFAAMDAQKQREISRKGGIASHEKGRGHEFTSEEAREAGRKGGRK